MYIAGLQTLRVTFDDSTNPTKSNWESKSFLGTSVISLDPILFTDKQTGRTFVSQLISGNGLGLGCSLTAYSDDDGDNWIQSEGCGLPTSGADHQSIGGGPFAAPLTRDPALPVYPNSVYYCSQATVTAFCARSDDGGTTFGPGIPVYTTECGGLHGHPMVAPDGTVYFGFQNGDGHPRVAVSHDRGATWTTSVDVGEAYGIKNTAFPRVVAGDDNRAAFAFLGTPTEGPFQDSNFAGEWHLYISHTFDGGQTWSTVDATPGDPVQRGCIWMQGGSNPCRNLLDFMGSAVDKEGRVLIGYADGCVGPCINGGANSYTKKATIARQSGGKRLFAAFDPPVDPTPTPTPSATPTPTSTPAPSNVLHFHGNPTDDPPCT